MTPELKWGNIEIDHVKPICMFDVSKDKKIERSVLLEKYSTTLKKDHQQKRTKLNILDYQLQFIEVHQFLNLHEERIK